MKKEEIYKVCKRQKGTLKHLAMNWNFIYLDHFYTHLDQAKALKGQMIGRILLDKMKWFLVVGND